jgi:mono/diheme cytochrome c family protein
MNYPIWELPGAGLLIAAVAVVHVFVSHFAVGGGLFLVVTERKARRENDAALLDYVRRLSRFFILLTLVFGALTGVGIWFTIALIHPQGTSSLINTFVWGWAIEWTFFVTEIAAAMVYYYGWDRLSARLHMAVGWIYFWAAWLSLVIINGILTYMLTPGQWIHTRGFWDGFFNPTYWPGVVARTFVAAGLAGMYALFTVTWSRDGALKAKVARYAGGWILPMAVALPLALWWYLRAAGRGGIPAGTILGSGGEGAWAALKSSLTLSATSGYPMAQRGVLFAVVGSFLVAILTLFILLARPRTFGRVITGLILVAGLLAFGGGEWVREDLRKPFIIGQYMFVNSVRLPPAEGIPEPPPEAGPVEDRFTVEALNRAGVLATSPWDSAPEAFLTEGPESASLPPEERLGMQVAAGRELFKLLCFNCHSVDGYNAIRPLVQGKNLAVIDGTLGRLARVEGPGGESGSWSDLVRPGYRLRTWRGRRMPPFVGTDQERRALAVYLAMLGGAMVEPEPVAVASPGRQVFEDYCAMCHLEEGDWPMGKMLKGRGAEELYDLIGRLPEVNEGMPPFEGSEEERRALADYLATFEPAGEPEEDEP